MATGGAGRVFRQNTNAGTLTGDGMGMAYRAGVPLRDMEFVQYHPTCLPGSGILMTEGCRGEGGILVNRDGYRYLQDYGLGPLDPWAGHQLRGRLRPLAPLTAAPRRRCTCALCMPRPTARAPRPPHTSTETSETTRSRVDSEDSVEVSGLGGAARLALSG